MHAVWGKFFYTVVGLSLAIAVLAVPSASVAAQQDEVTIDQRVTSQYGDYLFFEAQVQASTTIVGARLIVEIENASSPYVERITVTTGNEVSISHQVSIAELGLPPIATLSYQWVFEDAVGQEYTSPQGTLRYHDTVVPWTWTIDGTGRVFVYTDGTQSDNIPLWLSTAEGALADAERAIGRSLDGTVSIYIYPDLASLANSLRLHNLGVQDWVAAYALPDQGVILVALPSDPADASDLILRDIKHELTHVVIHRTSGSSRIPGWLDEGLALMLSGPPDPSLSRLLQESVAEGVVISIETMCLRSFASLPPHDAALAYAQSDSLIRYVVDRYGMSQVEALLTAYADGQTCDSGIRTVLGLSASDLERQWQNQIARDVIQTASPDPSPVPWLVILAIGTLISGLFIWPQPEESLSFIGPSTRNKLRTVAEQDRQE